MSDNGISMYVVPMMDEILSIADPVISEPALPNFRFAPDKRSEFMRICPFDQLNGALDGHILGRCKQEMHMVWHENKSMERVAALAAIVKESSEEQPRISFNGKQIAVMPGRESQKISSGRRKES